MAVGIDACSSLGPEAQLQRAVSDAESVSASLRRFGFDVRPLANGPAVTQDHLDQRFSIFEQSVHPGDIAVFYVAGHGVSFDRSDDLLPTDVPAFADPDLHMLRRPAVEGVEIRERMRSRGPAVVLPMLDACRNNPIRSHERGTMSRGLKPIQAANGVPQSSRSAMNPSSFAASRSPRHVSHCRASPAPGDRRLPGVGDRQDRRQL